jgi:glucose-6-phosphate 1-dehydrogenase
MPSITVEPCTFALFGALGDLALRKLFPALYQLDGAGLLHEDTRILALAREPVPSSSTWPISKKLRRTSARSWTKRGRTLPRAPYLHVDFLKPKTTWPWLKWPAARLIAYFATPAAVYGAICENLAKVGLAENTRVVLENPSVRTWSPRARSTTPWRSSSRKTAPTASTTTWAKRTSRT